MASAMARSGGVQPPQGDAQRVQDLQQLQREYRHMELNRRAYAEESQQLLRKQQVRGARGATHAQKSQSGFGGHATTEKLKFHGSNK